MFLFPASCSFSTSSYTWLLLSFLILLISDFASIKIDPSNSLAKLTVIYITIVMVFQTLLDFLIEIDGDLLGISHCHPSILSACFPSFCHIAFRYLHFSILEFSNNVLYCCISISKIFRYQGTVSFYQYSSIAQLKSLLVFQCLPRRLMSRLLREIQNKIVWYPPFPSLFYTPERSFPANRPKS